MPSVHIEFRGDQDTRRGPFNRCIYCGDATAPQALTDEHAVPEAIGGRVVLMKASCLICKGAVDRFESQCHNQMFASVRAHLGLKKTKAKRRKRNFRVNVTVGGKRESFATSIERHPAMLHLVSFAPPGILLQQPPSKDFKDTRWWAWDLGDERAFQEKLAHIQQATKATAIHLEGVFLPHAFGRFLAKIAHCIAITTFGPDSFRPMLPAMILNDDAPIAYLVGAESAGTPVRTNALHHDTVLGCLTDHRTGHELLYCSIRLFAWLETPTYIVIVGEPGPTITQQLSGPSA